MRASRYGCATLFTIVGTLFLCCGLTLVQCAPFYAPGPNPRRVPVPIDRSVLLERDGVDLIVVNNGALRFSVVPTRGAGAL